MLRKPKVMRVASAQLLHHQLVLTVGRHRKRCGILRNRSLVTGAIDRRARRDDQATIPGAHRAATPAIWPCWQRCAKSPQTAARSTIRPKSRRPDGKSSTAVRDGSASALRLAASISPFSQCSRPMRRLSASSDRAVADAMNAIAPISQHPNEMPADEAIGAGNPHRSCLCLVTDKRIEPAGPMVEALCHRKQRHENALGSKRGAPQRAWPESCCSDLSTTAVRSVSIV